MRPLAFLFILVLFLSLSDPLGFFGDDPGPTARSAKRPDPALVYAECQKQSGPDTLCAVAYLDISPIVCYGGDGKVVDCHGGQ